MLGAFGVCSPKAKNQLRSESSTERGGAYFLVVLTDFCVLSMDASRSAGGDS